MVPAPTPPRNPPAPARSGPASHPSQHGLIAFLQAQPQGTLHRLYTKPSACLAVFRLLSALERQVIMTLLWLEQPLETSMVTSWITMEGRIPYRETLQSLAYLHILPDSKSKLLLNSSFKIALKEALSGSGTQQSFGVPILADERQQVITVEQLDTYAHQRWETILHFMVTSGTEQVSARPSEGVLSQLEKSGLMVNEAGRRKITSGGFQFLLHSPHTQLWEFILSYLRMMAERPEMDMVDILSLLFTLSTTLLGQEYSTSGLSAIQLNMISELRDFGLVYFRPDSTASFHPTRLATTLTSANPILPTTTSNSAVGSGGENSAQGFIILETNYHLYAYTDNPLQTAVLNLFVSFKTRFANLIMGTITRESVKRALANGISADQIISYLVTHAHPQMRKNNPIIPVTVQDQIRLWEMEKHRVKGQEGYLYKEFASVGDYEVVLAYARDLGVVLWSDHSKRMFFADASGRTPIRQFIERRTTGGG